MAHRASMGPGRKPRKERSRAARAGTTRPKLQWGLGENPGRNRGSRAGGEHAGCRASMGPGRKPRKELDEVAMARSLEAALQWGLGENPGRNSRKW